MTSGVDRFTERQRDLLNKWLPEAQIVKDLSWGLIGTTVLEVEHGGTRYVAKAGDEIDHHLTRELRAHRNWLEPWTTRGLAPQLVEADEDAKLLLTQYLPGELVQGGEHEWRPDTYFQAGRLLAWLHEQSAVEDPDFETQQQEEVLDCLAKPHRIAPELAERLRDEAQSWLTPPAILVPTHGDWQPRNWLVHKGVVSAIDFGRAELRPAMTDFARLAAQQFRTDPTLETPFLEGYGGDPRQSGAWQRNRIREAVATAVWAYEVGDETFEQQGHRMIAEVLA